MITYDGMDDAIIGQASVWVGNGKVERVVYSGPMLVEVLMRDGMSEEEALEWVDYNMEGGYFGEETPVIVWEREDD